MTFKEGYNHARSHRIERTTPPSSPELPFPVATKKEFLSQFDKLAETMRTEPISLEDGYQHLLESKMPWRLSPESRIAHLYAEQAQLGKYNLAEQNRDPEAWRQLTPIHHEASVTSAKTIWNKHKTKILQLDDGDLEPIGQTHTTLRLALQLESKKEAISTQVADILKKKPNLDPILAHSQAIDIVIGQPFINSTASKIRSTKAYYHAQRLSDRAKFVQESLDLNQAITAELPKSSFKIGAVDALGHPVFFEMAMIKNITIDPATGKEKGFPQGMVIQEPGWTDQQRKNRPVGLAILPWYEAFHQASSGDVYINIGLRNEPGANNYSTAVTGEQTSGTKMVTGDILNQPGGAVIAVCVGEKLAVHCEQVPELTEEVSDDAMNAALANRDSNRMGGGHNAYATLKVEDGSPLLPQYAKNMWIKLTDLEELITENNQERPIVNDLLLAAKSQLDQRLRNQAEAKVAELDNVLSDIANNPLTLVGWTIGGFINQLEQLFN